MRHALSYLFLALLSLWGMSSSAEASCGSVSCFVVIGSQQAISPAGVLTVNFNYTYTPNGIPSTGVDTIPFANSQLKQLILANSKVSQLSTLVKTAALDLNYGLTERVGLEVLIPYKFVDAVGQIGTAAVSNNSDRGIGDVLAKVKYNMLPTLRSMLILKWASFSRREITAIMPRTISWLNRPYRSDAERSVFNPAFIKPTSSCLTA